MKASEDGGWVGKGGGGVSGFPAICELVHGS